MQLTITAKESQDKVRKFFINCNVGGSFTGQNLEPKASRREVTEKNAENREDKAVLCQQQANIRKSTFLHKVYVYL